jgi:hypothetical protein
VLSLSAGAHYMQVSKWLGHESYVTTLNVYADYIDTEEGGKAVPLARPTAPAPTTGGTVVPFRPRATGWDCRSLAQIPGPSIWTVFGLSGVYGSSLLIQRTGAGSTPPFGTKSAAMRSNSAWVAARSSAWRCSSFALARWAGRCSAI